MEFFEAAIEWIAGVNIWYKLAVIAGLYIAGRWVFNVVNYNKTRQKIEKLQADLKIGDTVVLASGIVGKLKSLTGNTAVLEMCKGVDVTVERYYISRRREEAASSGNKAADSSQGK